MHIRPYDFPDLEPLMALWERSVRATHDFLGEDVIEQLVPIVRRHVFPVIETWVLVDQGDILGFMSLNGRKVEALFVDPAHMGKGAGGQLMQHARMLKGSPLTLDVNEQNPSALTFYKRQGFIVTGRSPVDGMGLPFPLLHLAEAG
jgi:putative acetyltransferase